MAYAYRDQSGAVTVLPQQFPYPRLVSHPLGIPAPRVGFVVPNQRAAVPLVPVNFPLVGPFGLPLHPSVFIPMEVERSLSLRQYMMKEGLVPPPDEELKRRNVIEKLKKIILMWIKKIAWQRKLPNHVIRTTSATILTYGSYGLGVHGSESDIDALCVGPWFATSTEDFFIVLYNMLKSKVEVSDIHCVKDAKIPLMRFKFEGIPIDLPYAKLEVVSVPENVDLLNPMYLNGIDETSWKSLSGVCVNKRILQLVPNMENFQSLLRCIKLWAKRRGLYGNLFGYLGGVHLAILAAFVCQRNPNSSLSMLVASFFNTFAQWPWRNTPVMLHDGNVPVIRNVNEMRGLMPIKLPCSPYDYCHSNITRSTFTRIRSELSRGQNITKGLLKPDFDWGYPFAPYVYKYSQYVKICLSASDYDHLGDWVGWVKSRFPFLLHKVEEVLGFCDPSPTEYVDSGNPNPNVVFYWGLSLHADDNPDISSVEEDFKTNIRSGYQSPREMTLRVAQASELPDRSVKGTKACWRMPEYNDQQVPLYSEHLPGYFVGYLAPSVGG